MYVCIYVYMCVYIYIYIYIYMLIVGSDFERSGFGRTQDLTRAASCLELL